MSEASDRGGSASEGEGSGARALPGEVERAIRGVSEAETPAAAALTLAAIANRATAELNKLARTQSSARRGQSDWGAWAGLANTARDAVLKTATCRKVASQLAQKTSA
jgi:hypothetical protein